MKQQNKIPEGWKIENLSDICTIKGRIGWQGLTTKEYKKEGNYYLVTGTDFDNGKIIWEKCIFIDKERYDQDTNIQLKNDDLLITKDGSIGKVAIVKNLPGKATLNSGIFVVRPKMEEYSSDYLYWVMQSKFFTSFINTLKAGSTISHLYQRDFVNFKFPLPHIEEQKAISKILSAIDEQIDIVERERRATERLRRDVMVKLLEKKDGWKEYKFEDICIKIQSGGTPLTSMREYYSGDVPFVKIEDITNSGKYIKDTQIKISKKGLENSSAWIIPENSLLIAIYGSLGKTTINKIPLATNQAILGIIIDKEKADLEYIYYLINNTNLKKYAKQSTQANLTAEIIRNLEIYLPSLLEQRSIAQILSTIDEKLELDKKAKIKLEKLKRGLMHDLLTGNKRVKKILEVGV